MQFRSSIAIAITLMLTTSSLVKALPETQVGPAGSSDVLASEAEDNPTLDPGVSATASIAPSIGPTQTVAKATGRPKPTFKKGEVGIFIDSSGVPVADLFTPEEERIGITSNSITLCGHAALSLAEAFDTRPQDLNLYWDELNKKGGVHGRNVHVEWKDDAYTGDGARVAADQCKDLDSFFMLGGIGFDQNPIVRNWAETERMLYIHHMAWEDPSKKFSFSYLASVEKAGQMFAEWILAHHKNEDIGVVWRNSPNWKPGYNKFKELISGKINLKVDIPVISSQSLYTSEIAALQNAEVKTVFFWENALMATDMIAQARNQGYHPTWVIFPFNTTTDNLEPHPLDKPFEGIATWGAYSQGVYTPGWEEEQKRFEAALAAKNVKPNDILWMTWVGMKQLHKLLLDCQRDCTRNKIAGLLLTGTHKSDP
ncbi:MAG TPA: ABC transporter substrate-binding protein, partial [Actinomycetota bacterium]|nr:ABC transporter substrate-binding protein [Actinomycetota bacterium]